MNQFLLGGLLLLGAIQQPAGSGVNLFSLRQDLEIGAEAAAKAEKTLAVMRDPATNDYLRNVGIRLSAHSALTSLPYRFRAVNSKEIDSVTFPGGAVYVNRGLIELAANEPELAAMLAHEIAHAAARHGTAQLTRQLLVQAPVSIAAGLPVTDGWKDQLIRLGISFDARAPFLRYSPDQELEADLAATEMLTKAGYPPQALASFLKKAAHPGEGTVAPPYVYNHPHGSTLNKDVQAAIDKRPLQAAIRPTETFRTFQTNLTRMPLPPPPRNAVAGAYGRGTEAATPLPNEFRHPQEYYKLNYPAEWQLTRTGPNGAMIAPAGGLQSRFSHNDLVRGMTFDLFDISERPMTLEQATNRLIASLRQKNESLQVIPGAQSQMLVDGEPGFRTVMVSKGRSEIAWVVTRIYYQNLFYMVCVAPEDRFSEDQPKFEQIIRSVQLR